MNIFNSLGSNYNAAIIWRSLFVPGSRKSKKQLTETLAEYYSGNVVLTYKGRQALELAFENSGLPKGSAVGINGFTCYVVYQAVERAGYKPVMIDVAPRELHFGLKELKKSHNKYKNLKAIVVQNTLGFPVDIAELENFSKKHDIMIIEDLAHSFGAKYADGREAGTVGDFTMLSFSQDKQLDVVAGGALIDRREKSEPIAAPTKRVSAWQREKNSMYPLWTALIRGLYPLRLGRYLHFGLKKLHLMATPMSDNVQGVYKIEPSAARLLIDTQWPARETELEHRRSIAKIYEHELPKTIQFKPTVKARPSYHRFPIWVEDRAGLISYLKQLSIYVGDTWYDAPIAPKKYLGKTNYKTGDCPHADVLAMRIVNLPTHRQVGEVQARFIAEEVKSWLASK